MPRPKKVVTTKSVYPGKYVTSIPRWSAFGKSQRICTTTPYGGPHKQVLDAKAPKIEDW